MRLILALSSALALFGQQQQQQVPQQSVPDPSIKLGRITGKVLNAITGEPVRKATVSLQPAGGQQGGGGQTRGLSAATDNAGAFVFENVNPGNYRLSGEKTGFIRSNFGGRGGGAIGAQLAIAAGTEKAEVIVRITPQGIVSGRILDEDGEPMEGVSIQLLRPQYFASQRRIMGAAGNQSNDRGEFRVTNVAPGKYYLLIQRMNNSNMPLQQGKEEFGYPRLFFPGVEAIEQAQRVEVGAGQEVANLQMALRKVRVYRVRGHVPGIAAPAAQQPGAQAARRGGNGMVIQLRPDGGSSDMMGPGFGPGMGGGQVRADGSFEIAGVSPGAYKLTLSSFGEGRPKVVGSLKLSVGNDDVDGVVLAPSPLVSFQGKIVIEGDRTAVNMKSVRLQLMSTDMGGMGFNPPIEVAEDGSFAATELSQDKYRITVTPGAAAYVKAITVGGQNILDTAFDLSGGGGGAMEVLLSTKIATINGTVEKQKPDDAPGSVVIVKVGPNSELTLLSSASGQSALARVDESGKFSVANLPPGEYKLIAFEEVDLATASDPEFLKKFEDRAATVKIGEGESKSATIKQIRFAETNPSSN